jgi:hypothetical protein
MVTFVLPSLSLLSPRTHSEFDRTCNPLFTKPSLITYMCVCVYHIYNKRPGGDESGDRAKPPFQPFYLSSSSFLQKSL